MNISKSDVVLSQKIKEILDVGTEALSPEILKNLENARQYAVSRKKTASFGLRVGTLAGAGHRFFYGSSGHSHKVRILLASAVCLSVVLAIGAAYWQFSRANKTECIDVDTAMLVLSDELPLSAYSDQGFSAYLNKVKH